MAIIYRNVTFEQGEFETKFPEISNRVDLNESDKVRVALGLAARFARAGAPKGNKNNPNGRRINKETINDLENQTSSNLLYS